MIIIKLIGGLGNQLFQYAAAKSLAHFHGVELKADATAFDKYKLRNFDLQQLDTNLSLATEKEIIELKAINQFERVRQYLKPLKKRTFYKERFFNFDNNFFKLNSNVYLQGYWQSEKYFSIIEDIIRQDFIFPTTLVAKVLATGGRIAKENAVSIHIRRGDYKNPEMEKYHGILPIEYYRKAIAVMQERYPSIKFYLFSDDMNWANQHFENENIICVSGSISHTHFEDLYLMSQCSHNIIANSSFSWWGAWLNKNKNKVIISPKNWFNEVKNDTKDLIPGKWIRL
jgi:hypothetical protein